MAGRKIFVGSLPNGIQEITLRQTFQQYGEIEDVFIKPGCEPGRQWAFVTYASPEQAQLAKESCDRILTFSGTDRPCDVMVARNQGMFGQQREGPPPNGVSVADEVELDGPKKIFVGSLPDDITAGQLQAEFSKYGNITDTYVKEGCEPGRQWAFVTFTSASEAQNAKVATDRILIMPGAKRPCEVTLARHQGMFGQEPVNAAPAAIAASLGPKKVFVGSLPDNVEEHLLRAEFDRYGRVVDVFLKTGCEPGRQWAFVTYNTPEEAQAAKEATDRKLILPGADRACEVMLARNQGKFGQEGMTGGPGAYVPMTPMAPAYGGGGTPYGYMQVPPGQPPPPTAPPPAHLTPWRCYYTAAGLPYYHNHASGTTQWECPPEFQVAPTAAARPTAAVQQSRGARYSPY